MMPAIGYAVRRENRFILSDPKLNAAEITFEHADLPLWTKSFINGDDIDYVAIHALKLSVGSPDPPGKAYLDALKGVAIENNATAISDHLGFTRDGEGGVEMGHFAPVPLTQPALDVVCRNLDYVQKYVDPFPFYIETIAYLFQLEGTMSEPEFLKKMFQRTGVGWLLDVTNVYANGRNFGFDPKEFVEEVMPYAPRVQMHLAGGFFDEEQGLYFDTHSQPIPDDVWDLYEYSLKLGQGKVDAVFIERDAEFPGEEEWRRELHKMYDLAEGTSSSQATVNS
ncbi:multinuclear nonheme iron-dependent oxidase [Rubinisphaera margarita]|uniref:multinuclear nonheme iron-dependent oxidase n=1 Tax=Rubinisphaera margarita TaxID=2909586 RepID=UPI001EE97C6F|nr:DUF692 family multinuclear iron-containing protein [Rubinisphaera margarita]MCG6156311.1 DUF692 domain-containing protein [Rubinisphaera margarita]